MSHEPMTMRMATVFAGSSLNLDPAVIGTIQEYELIQNLYRPLVEYDHKHNLVPGLAKSFYWEGESLIFEFDPARAITMDGDAITAEDAARTLKRAIFFGKTGHGDLRTFLCPDYVLDSLDSDCPGIHIKNDKLVLTPVRSAYKTQLLRILESADYSVLPAKALSKDPKDPKIVSHLNTSGTYFVAKDDSTGAWLLKINSRNYSVHPDLPESIQLVPVNYLTAIEQMNHGDFDYLPTSAIAGTVSVDSLLGQRDRFNFHESMAFRLRLIAFSRSAMKDFTPEQRLHGAQLMSKYLESSGSLKGEKPTVEFFQALSEGALTEAQRNEILKARKNQQATKLPRPLTVGAPEPVYSKFKTYFADSPEIKVLELKDYAFNLPASERPDMYIVYTDSAWTESLSLLGHNFNASVFHLPGLDSDKWIASYIQTEDKNERLALLKKLHFDLLKNVAIYPVSVSPYYTFARKPWSLNFSPFSSGTELWQMRREK